MTHEEIMLLDFNGIETRASELQREIPDADAERLEAINGELDAIEERRAILKAEVEEKRKAAEAVIAGAGKEIETRKETPKMTDREIRNSNEYVEAFAKYIKTGKDMECRALLSDNASGGVVPVPDFVAGIVAKQLEESKILSRVRRMNAAGNVKIGFEYSAPAAVAHTEGGDPITEEALALGIVTLIPKTWKKFVKISDEALDSMNGEAYLSYIYEEVARGIIKAREDAVVAAILAAPDTADATHPSVKRTGTTTAALADFVNGRALLSSAARDLVIICTPAQYATYRGLQMAASYGVDPFDGLEVLFNDTATAPIIGDLAGVMENVVKDIEFKYDDKTLMTSDIVQILGRMPSAIEVVGDKFFAVIGEEESE